MSRFATYHGNYIFYLFNFPQVPLTSVDESYLITINDHKSKAAGVL